jgi:hypothetical protein
LLRARTVGVGLVGGLVGVVALAAMAVVPLTPPWLIATLALLGVALVTLSLHPRPADDALLDGLRVAVLVLAGAAVVMVVSSHLSPKTPKAPGDADHERGAGIEHLA